MEHSDAIETNAPDRYLLGELSAAEADAFEDHYFDCPVCTEDVRIGMSFMDGGRRLVREVAPVPDKVAPVVPIDTRRRTAAKWFPATAAAAVLAILGNVGLLMRLQSVPVASFSATMPAITFGTMRGAGNAKPVSDPVVVHPNSTIPFEMPAVDTAVQEYRVQFLDDAGKVRAEEIFTPQQAAEDGPKLTIHNARPGNYQLVIIATEPAGQSHEIARRAVIVQRAEDRGGQPQ